MMENNSQSQDNISDLVNILEEPADPMEDFSQQLQDIINTYGSAGSMMEEQISILEKEEEQEDGRTGRGDRITQIEDNNPEESPAQNLLQSLGDDAVQLRRSLDSLGSAEEKLEAVLTKFTEVLEKQQSGQRLLQSLQQKHSVLLRQKEQLQCAHSQGLLARSKLESLCRQLHGHNKSLRDDMLQRGQEDERKRSEISSHFQRTLVDIQAQIDHHSNHNNRLCQENTELGNKLKTIVEQYEKREESLEKIFKQKALQQQLADTKLEEANLLLKEAEEKHIREKEYLLKEAIDKTKKCFTMKEQELEMKKQLVLYSQKFDDFQATLAKSNEVYITFKQEMEKMSKKMKKLEKESNLWKVKFESCNKALTDMIEERSEKGKELELFTLKIAKLETLCRALQDERKVLYSKIKGIRQQAIATLASGKDTGEEEIPDLAQLPEPKRNPALTTEMEKLWKEQARLQEFAASLLASTGDDLADSESEEEPDNLCKPQTEESDSVTKQKSGEEKGANEEAALSGPGPVKPEEPGTPQECNQQEAEEAEPPKEEAAKEKQNAPEPHETQPTEPSTTEQNQEVSTEGEVQPEAPKEESITETVLQEPPNTEPETSQPPPSQVDSVREKPPTTECTRTEPEKLQEPEPESESATLESSSAGPNEAQQSAPNAEAAKPKTSKPQKAKPKNGKVPSQTQGSSKKKSQKKS